MSRTILIVEDELAIADSIAYALRTDGFTPVHVTLGAQALAALRDAPAGAAPQLLVLDVGLPDMNGFELCRQLRQFSDVPVIFLTARSDEIDRIVGLEIGADDYVTKPFSPRELVARIRVVLRRLAPRPAREGAGAHAGAGARGGAQEGAREGANPGAGAAANVPRFDVRTHEARILYAGHALELTRYEYLLLKALLEHPGHVLSRAQLMDRVWAGAPDTLERTVDAHIKTLRAKLRAIDPAPDPIQTHRGMGYSVATA